MPNGVHKHMEVEMEEPEERVHAVVIDGSSFTFIDSVGLHALPAVSIRVYLLLILDVNLQISRVADYRIYSTAPFLLRF